MKSAQGIIFSLSYLRLTHAQSFVFALLSRSAPRTSLKTVSGPRPRRRDLSATNSLPNLRWPSHRRQRVSVCLWVSLTAAIVFHSSFNEPLLFVFPLVCLFFFCLHFFGWCLVFQLLHQKVKVWISVNTLPFCTSPSHPHRPFTPFFYFTEGHATHLHYSATVCQNSNAWVHK